MKEIRKLNRSVKFDMFLTFLILLGGINYFFIAFRQNLFNIFGQGKGFIYILIALAAMYKLKLETFLPFLDWCAFPTDTLSQTYPVDANAELTLFNLPPNAKIVYWAAESDSSTTPSDSEDDEESPSPYDAYGEYSNSGIVQADSNGEALLKLRCPKNYSVGKIIKYKLPKHVHYRYEISPAIFSKVFTQEIEC